MRSIICAIVRVAARGTALFIAALFLAFLLGESGGPLRLIGFREWAGMAMLFAATIGMLLAWKWELPAALTSLFALGAFAAVVHMQNYAVLAIASVPGLLFLLDWELRRFHSPWISTAGRHFHTP